MADFIEIHEDYFISRKAHINAYITVIHDLERILKHEGGCLVDPDSLKVVAYDHLAGLYTDPDAHIAFYPPVQS